MKFHDGVIAHRAGCGHELELIVFPPKGVLERPGQLYEMVDKIEAPDLMPR